MSAESRPTVNENTRETGNTLYISELDINKALGHMVKKQKRVEFKKLLDDFEKTAMNVIAVHESSKLPRDASDKEIIKVTKRSRFMDGFWTNMAALNETGLLLYTKKDERVALFQLNKESNRAPALLSGSMVTKLSPTNRRVVSPKKPVKTRIANHNASKPAPIRRSA